MDLILLPGNSIENKEWIEDVECAVSSDFNTTHVQYYDHWEKGGKVIDLDVETGKLTKMTDSLGEYVIFAKSAGVILALKGIAEGKINPAKCIFAGTAVPFALRLGFDIKKWLGSCSVQSLFIQKEFDPAISFEDLTALLKTSGVKNYEVLKVSGSDHYYGDIVFLKKTVVNFMLKTPKKNSDRIVYGIQGGIGSFNHEAILKYTEENNIEHFELRYLYTTEKVLWNLHVGSVDCGLFAIHNTVGGMVEETIRAMAEYKFETIDAFTLKIRHFLMKLKDVDKESISVVMAHPQVLKQCSETLKQKYPNLLQKSGEHDLIDTAAAAKALSEGRIPRETAILGPEGLSNLFGLEIIDKDLQDDAENLTKFMVVKRI